MIIFSYIKDQVMWEFWSIHETLNIPYLCYEFWLFLYLFNKKKYYYKQRPLKMMSDTSYRTQKNYINTSKNGKYIFIFKFKQRYRSCRIERLKNLKSNFKKTGICFKNTRVNIILLTFAITFNRPREELKK